MNNYDFLSRRISPDDGTCIEGWTGNKWVPICYCFSYMDSVIHLILDRDEGETVELTHEDIMRTLYILEYTKGSSKHIKLLKKALEKFHDS